MFWRAYLLGAVSLVLSRIEPTCGFKPWAAQTSYPNELFRPEVIRQVLREELSGAVNETLLERYVDLWAVYPHTLITSELPEVFPADLSLKIHNRLIGGLFKSETEFSDYDKEKCYVLVLSGGSNRGAWEVAALRGLVTRYKNEGKVIDWDVISGVSVGAIGAYSALFQKSVNEWTNELWNYWWTAQQSILSDCQVPLKKNIGNWIQMLLKKMIDPDAVFQYLCGIDAPRKILKRRFGLNKRNRSRSVTITATRIEDGLSKTWFGWNSTDDELLDAVFASLAYPLVYRPTYVKGSYYMDGGIRGNANLIDPIRHCMEFKNVTIDKVVVDYIETQPIKPHWKWFPSEMNIRDHINRAFDILHFNVRGLSKLKEAVEMFPEATFRHYLTPTSWSDFQFWPTLALDVTDRPKMIQMMKMGLSAGMKAGAINQTQLLEHNRTVIQTKPIVSLPPLNITMNAQ
ncbi:secreted hydrolase-like signal peptide-containing protein [Cryptosporidium canis]|uniref:Secreted hydrolase-like signal peptide-containing protein n=1 Tax=Cryptosporidium canis TaxID=195482 RepID=A0ABQ8PAT6_9CRYT|nr:secreted hydrolase-like signal peptide-containing protein [Cryptosporidium canis]KAJ1614197.1 secreted hydrolase-like signal peptide-containing protein [Cryptosporidium canis]